MKFQKGMPRPINSGRKKGSKNKKKIARVSDVLTEKDINPAEKILELIPFLDEKDAIEAWFDLLSYCQSKPKQVEEEEIDPDEGMEDLPDDEGELLKLVKPEAQ